MRLLVGTALERNRVWLCVWSRLAALSATKHRACCDGLGPSQDLVFQLLCYVLVIVSGQVSTDKVETNDQMVPG